MAGTKRPPTIVSGGGTLVSDKGLLDPYRNSMLTGGSTVGLSNHTALTTANHKAALIGRVRTGEGGTVGGSKNIATVGFRAGTVTMSTSTGIQVSLQDISTVNAAVPLVPDGVADQSVVFTPTSGAWNTATLGSSRTVSDGDLLAVVFEWSGFGGTPTFVTAHLSVTTTAVLQAAIMATTDGGTTWTAASLGRPNVLFGFDDGTFGSFHEGLPMSNAQSAVFNSGTAASSGAGAEVALEFTPPFDTKCNGASVLVSPSSVSADLDVSLYAGTTVLGSMTLDANQVMAITAGGLRPLHVFWPEVTLTRDTTYRIGVKATTANNISLGYADVSSASHLQGWPGSTSFICNSRTGAGAWGTALTTRRPFIYPRWSAAGAI